MSLALATLVLALAAGGAARTGPEPLRVVESLDLPRALWGGDVPDSVKAMAVAWDPVRGRLWTSGMSAARAIASDPAAGHPVSAVELDPESGQIPWLCADPARRRLVWASRSTGRL